MTWGMQFRLWFRQASVFERRVVIAVVVAVALIAALTVAAVPEGDGETGLAVGLTAGGPTTTAPVGDAGVVDPSGAAATDGSVPASSTGGGQAAPAGSPSITTGSTSTAAPGTPTTDIGGTSPSSVTLAASDRGISEEEVRIGFLPAQTGGLDNAGFALGVRDDAGEYAVALAEYVNKRGGVIGRRVVPFVRKTDPLNQPDQAAACQAMVNDHKVFGVVDVGAIADTPYMKCLAVDNEMPYIHNTIWGTDWLAQSKGLEVGYPAAIDRVSKTWVRDLKAMSWLPQGGVVGVIGDRCAATDKLIDDVLVPEIKAAGVKTVVVEKHDCDAPSVVGQPSSFVVRFRAAGVTHVFLAANFASNTVFMNTAQSQGYEPLYTGSDWWQVSSDSSAANYPPDQFHDAVAITSNGLLLPQSGKPVLPGWERCNEAAIEAGLPELKHEAGHQELFVFCDNFFLLLDGLTAAGPNPTRWDWAAAIQGLGEHPSLMYGPSRFAPGKVTGSDTVFTARYDRNCPCFKAVTDYRPAAA